MGQLVPKWERYSGLVKLMNDRRGEIQNALPKHLSPERMIRVFQTAVTRTPKLLECDDGSLWNCMITASELGLEPSGAQGMAYMIPYKNNKTNKTEAQFQIGYQGLMVLARRSGEISMIDAFPVYDGDEFEITYGLNPDIKHKPNPSHPSYADPAKLTGCYAVAKLKDGNTQWDYMTRKEVDGIRARSKASNSGPWQTDYIAMAKKTVIKRLCKMLPKSVEIMRAIDLSDASDAGKPQWTDDVYDVSEFESAEVEPEETPEPEPAAEPSEMAAKIAKAAAGLNDLTKFDELVSAVGTKLKQDGDPTQWNETAQAALLVEIEKAARA